MALASAAAENAAVSGITAVATYFSVHTASPGTTGANEGASTTRQSISWSSPSGGSATNSAGISIDLQPSTTYTHFGTWSAVSSGTYYIGGTLSPNITTGSSGGTLTVASGALSLGGS